MARRPNGSLQSSLPAILGVEPIATADLQLLKETRGVKPLPIKRLSDRHHKLARAIASGRSNGECAIIAGYDPSRVSVLKADSTFKDLVAYYRTQASRGDDLLHDQLSGLSFDAVSEMRRRLEEEPDTLTNDELARMAQLGLDRTGYGAKRTEEKTVNVNFGSRLDAARRRVIEAEAIDITPAEAAE